MTDTITIEERDLLLDKLGQRALDRMLLFKKYDGSFEIKPETQVVFMQFLDQVNFRPTVDPSIFLSSDGELEIAWNDADKKGVQLVFSNEGILVFHEAVKREEMLPHSAYAVVAAEFSLI